MNHVNVISILHCIWHALSPSNISTLHRCIASHSLPPLFPYPACGRIYRYASDRMLTENSWPQTCGKKFFTFPSSKYMFHTFVAVDGHKEVYIRLVWRDLKGFLAKFRGSSGHLKFYHFSLSHCFFRMISSLTSYLSDPSNWEQRAGSEIGVPGALKICFHQKYISSVLVFKERYLGGDFTTQEWQSNPNKSGEINWLFKQQQETEQCCI